MDAVHAEVARFLASERIARTTPVVVALSGGGDSTALVLALASLSQRVAAAHVHHGLRGADADADLDFSAELARRLGIPFAYERVAADVRDGRSPEARSRRLRYAALERLRAAQGGAWIATAHTRDDQAETLLLRAARGSGVAGLAGIAARDDGRRLLRPLLGLRRRALRDYLRARGQGFREDATNASAEQPRARARTSLLPALEALHPGAVDRLAALAAAARDTDEFVAAEAARLLAQAAVAADGGLWLDRARLAAAAPALRARALAVALRGVGLAERVSRTHLRRIEAFAASAAPGARLSLPGGIGLRADRGALFLGPEPGPRPPLPFRVELSPPLGLALPQRGLRLAWSRPEREASGPALRVPRVLPAALYARSARAGDALVGDDPGRRRPLKEIFAGARWSGRERARAVVVECAGQVVWVAGIARAELVRGAAAAWELRLERLSGVGGSC
jgi:tRNA(Ile)-lysidine synthase